MGYYLRDRHTSVTALVDSGGAVTNTYAYGDYGAPALLDGRPGTRGRREPPAPARAEQPVHRTTAAALQGHVSPTGPRRDPRPAPGSTTRCQGRFTTRDAANVHNRYVGFDTNPIMKFDPTGHSALADTIIDALFVLVFAVSVVATAGAAAIAGATVLAAAEVGAEVAAAVVRTAVSQAFATAVNLIGAGTQAARLADDISVATGGKHFFDADTRQDLANVGTLAGGLAGASGLVAAGWHAGLAELEAVRETQPLIADVEGVVPEASTLDEAADSTSPSDDSQSARVPGIGSDDDEFVDADDSGWNSDLDSSDEEDGFLGPKPKIPFYQDPFEAEFNDTSAMTEAELRSQARFQRAVADADARVAREGSGSNNLIDESWRNFEPDSDPQVSDPSKGVHNAATNEPANNAGLPGTQVLDRSTGPRLDSGDRTSVDVLDPHLQLTTDNPYPWIEE